MTGPVKPWMHVFQRGTLLDPSRRVFHATSKTSFIKSPVASIFLSIFNRFAIVT
jgi:hypothetical protein